MKMRNLVIVNDSRIFRRYWEQWYRNNPKYKRAVDAEFKAIPVYNAIKDISREVTQMRDRDVKRPLNVVFLGNHIDGGYFYDAISAYDVSKKYVTEDWFNIAVSNYEDKQVVPTSTFKITDSEELVLEYKNPF